MAGRANRDCRAAAGDYCSTPPKKFSCRIALKVVWAKRRLKLRSKVITCEPASEKVRFSFRSVSALSVVRLAPVVRQHGLGEGRRGTDLAGECVAYHAARKLALPGELRAQSAALVPLLGQAEGAGEPERQVLGAAVRERAGPFVAARGTTERGRCDERAEQLPRDARGDGHTLGAAAAAVGEAAGLVAHVDALHVARVAGGGAEPGERRRAGALAASSSASSRRGRRPDRW